MLKELDSRSQDGISVSLCYDTELKTPVISLGDLREDISCVFTVPPDCALDAFHHPFSYAHSAKVI